MLATGARIGEILALRWEDLDLAAERPTLTICGTLVFVKGQGFFRQPWVKSDAGWRMVVLPRFAVGMIMARKLAAAGNPHDAIFASRRGTWLSPNNVRRQWREDRADTDLAWVTPHTFRKTVATLIKEETDTKSAAAQLGHSSEESPPRTTSPNPPKPRTSRTSSSDSVPTAGEVPHTHCPTMRRGDEPGRRLR
ncbi:tyrosine-type recombinase/integrase [Micromonospora trifolii]|uniref:tyrosine-type recombinase/integrase n=1 Tax=Micromonospora trifolii TaxID=2911208 RepID=UPI003D2EB069